MTAPYWRPRRGELIATVDRETGEPNDEVIEVLDGGEAHETRISASSTETVWCWRVHVRHLAGEWAGEEMWLALLPGEYVKVTR